MALWAPRLHEFYRTRIGGLYERYSNLQPNFRNSIFPCATFNFGPRTCCKPHIDFNNLPFGWCAITALGNFDPTKGGHLVLWDLGIAIEFPPGSTIIIPSGSLRHSNIDILQDETRYSFTQYAAGGLFRWVEHGFQTEKSYKAGLNKEELKAEGQRRWEEGVGMFSTLEELRTKYKKPPST